MSGYCEFDGRGDPSGECYYSSYSSSCDLINSYDPSGECSFGRTYSSPIADGNTYTQQSSSLTFSECSSKKSPPPSITNKNTYTQQGSILTPVTTAAFTALGTPLLVTNSRESAPVRSRVNSTPPQLTTSLDTLVPIETSESIKPHSSSSPASKSPCFSTQRSQSNPDFLRWRV